MLVFCLYFFFCLFLLSFFPFARWRCSCSLLFAPQTSSRSHTHTHTRHTAVSHSIYNPGHNAYKLIQHGNVFSKVHLYYFLHLSFFFSSFHFSYVLYPTNGAEMDFLLDAFAAATTASVDVDDGAAGVHIMFRFLLFAVAQNS